MRYFYYRAAAGVGEEAHSRVPAAALVPMVETGECGDLGSDTCLAP